MDEEMAELFGEPFWAGEFNIDYEFDAPQYYDFSRPETDLEAREAELWFEWAGTYPPSPFIVKLNWRYDNPTEYESTSPKSKPSENTTSITHSSNVCLGSKAWAIGDINRGSEFDNQMAQEIPKAKSKSPVKSSPPRSSTLMKPTASLLAKLNQSLDVHPSQLSRRCQKSLFKFDDKSSQNSSVIQCQATKRQKLEAGYLRKVARLKHQALFVHKVPKNVGALHVNSTHGRYKVTIPREPELETTLRAQRRRSKVNAESTEQAKLNSSIFKARPLNRKILEASSLPLPKKSRPRLPEFQVFNLRTSERAMQRASNYAEISPTDNSVSQNKTMDSRMIAPFLHRMNSVDASKKEKCKEVHKFKDHQVLKLKACPLNRKDFKFPTDKRFQDEPLTELFSKLSLASKAHSNIKVHLPAEIANMIKKKSERFQGKNYLCGSDRRTTEIGPLLKVNRSLDIC